MKAYNRLSGLILVFILLFSSAAVFAKGKAIAVGQSIELKATKKAGVPLHKEAKPSMFGRAPHGSKAKVLAIKKNWYQVELQDGKKAWIVKKYIVAKASRTKVAAPKKAAEPKATK